MKIGIVGAGAIGGVLGAWLGSLPEARVSVLARGVTLAALRRDGWVLEGQPPLPVQASDDAASLGVQDLVVIAVKAPALASVAPAVRTMCGPQTLVLPAMNGVPWWFFDGLAVDPAPVLASVDPGGVIARTILSAQVIGCVVHFSALAVAPGQVRHGSGRGLIVGEPRGGTSERVEALAATLSRAGFEVTVSPRIQRDVWFKLWGNLTMNPVSALTGATADAILDDPLVRAFCSAVMVEARTIGAAIGLSIDQEPEQRHAVTRRLGAFRTSMLQDLLAGRPLELDAIVGAVQEIGQHLGIPTPNIDALFGLTRLMARTKGLYPGG